MRTLYDPITILTVISVGLSIVGGFQEAAAIESTAQAEAEQIEAQAAQERLALSRDRDDLAKQASETQARARAVLAAQGGDTTTGTALALLTSNAGEFAIRDTRLLIDSRTRETLLKSQAGNIRRAGSANATTAIIGGFGSALGTKGLGNIFSRSPSVPTPLPRKP